MNNYLRLVHLKDDKSLQYYGNFCSGTSDPCLISGKLKLNLITGDLTIRNLQLDDENDYYYFCDVSNHWPTYELQRLDIFGKPFGYSCVFKSSICSRQTAKQANWCTTSRICDTIILTKNAFGCILVCQLDCLPAPNRIPENPSRSAKV